MDETEFERLLDQPESEGLDFKRELWKLETEEGVTDFLKDVICMANTPRDEPAHIIAGVGINGAGKKVLNGIIGRIDDADLQQRFDGKVFPVPVFNYQMLQYKGLDFGVITVPPASFGPSLPQRDLPKAGRETLRRNNMYLRRGSRNTLGGQEDLSRFFRWLHSRPRQKEDLELSKRGNWPGFLTAVHNFESNRNYVLVAAPIWPSAADDLPALATVSWTAVLDLDPRSDQDGLEAATATALAKSYSKYTLGPKDIISSLGAKSLPWIYARGLDGRTDAAPVNNYREWIRSGMHADVVAAVGRLAALTLPSATTAVVAAYDPNVAVHIRAILEALFGTYGAGLDIVIVTDDSAAFSAIADDLGASLFEIPVNQWCSGIASLDLSAEAGERKTLPTASGAPQSLAAADIPWIEEELEVLFLETGRTPAGEGPIGQAFMMGGEPDWYEIALHVDVDRDKYSRLREIVDQQLQSRTKTVRVNLYHPPGAGGSTLGRRLLWDLHSTYPCVIFHGSLPDETSERLARIYSITHRPILLMADSGLISERILDELFERLRSRQVAVVILQVLRRFSEQSEINLVVRLDEKLSATEATRFVDVYSRGEPLVRPKLEKIAADESSKERTPFGFGLATYGRNYRGLSKYVSVRLASVGDKHRKVLLNIAMVHHYAQQVLPAQIFAETLGLHPEETVDFSAILPPQALDLLVETAPGRWRTAHELFSSEIIEQTLGSPDRRTWRSKLPEAAISLADELRGSSRVASEAILEITRRVFVYRDNVELLGTERASAKRFAQLVEDISVPNAAVGVLLHLTTLYPFEMHFSAHLARLYALRLRDYLKAREWIDRAIYSSDDRDSALYHMKGMVLREQIYDLLRQGESVDRIADLLSDASGAFERARELRPDGDHGYISEAQMLIRVLQAAREQGRQYRDLIFSSGGDNLIAEAIGRTEDLLAQVRRMREGEGESSYERHCRAQLDDLYGQHDSAVQQYYDLLQEANVYKPPLRRQLVWTYLHHRGRDWRRLSGKELRRIALLLESNLEEEPENSANIRLWLRVIRLLPAPPSIDDVIERLELWRSVSPTLEVVYYLATFNALRAMEGSFLADDQFQQYRIESSKRAQFRRDRTRSIEWLGADSGIRRLVHQSDLGPWDDEVNFYTSTEPLLRIGGRVTGYDGPQAGAIELEGTGVKAFYVPARSSHTRRSLNQRVHCFVGFSYDGPRAWSVEDAP